MNYQKSTPFSGYLVPKVTPGKPGTGRESISLRYIRGSYRVQYMARPYFPGVRPETRTGHELMSLGYARGAPQIQYGTRSHFPGVRPNTRTGRELTWSEFMRPPFDLRPIPFLVAVSVHCQEGM
jgi:hypothetical protein